MRKPALTKARAVPSGRPLRSQDLDASQYSSNDEALRLMMSDIAISPMPRRAGKRSLEGSCGGRCEPNHNEQNTGQGRRYKNSSALIDPIDAALAGFAAPWPRPQVRCVLVTVRAPTLYGQIWASWAGAPVSQILTPAQVCVCAENHIDQKLFGPTPIFQAALCAKGGPYECIFVTGRSAASPERGATRLSASTASAATTDGSGRAAAAS
jgi:hypothetical protein